MKLEYSGQIFEKILIQNFMKICPVGPELFQADRRTNRTEKSNGRSSQFRNLYRKTAR